MNNKARSGFWATICSAMAIWHVPESVSRKDIFWFVVINTFLLNLASIIIVSIAVHFSAGHFGKTTIIVWTFTTPLAATLLYIGAKGLASSLRVRQELRQTTSTLATRNKELETAKTRLEKHANMDFLTSLPNRRAFYNTVTKRHHAAKQSGKKFWVAILDLDNFKPVNDTYGHDAGDAVLKRVGYRLRKSSKANSFCIARLGGDEFALAFDETALTNFQDELDLVSHVCDLLNAPVCYKKYKLTVKASVGLANWTRNIDNPLDLMRQSDQALIAAKAAGKGRICTSLANIKAA